MNRLLKIAQSAAPDTGVQFRRRAYGKSGIRQFLRDVLAMANAAVDGRRYIVTGADVSDRGDKRIYGVSDNDFSGNPSYPSLVTEFIEPPIRIEYRPVTVDKKTLGVFEIADCHDKPYMMRVDQSEKLRRGDAYVRVQDVRVKMGRRQLQELFEQKFHDSVPADRIEIGFPGEIIHKDFAIPTTDLAKLPSAVASGKLRQLIDIHMQSRNSGATSVMARMMHARLFGSDQPYQNRSSEDLLAEMEQVERKHRHENQHFLFEKNATKLQLVVYNQGNEPIEGASLSLVMPSHDAFHVAHRLPKTLHNGTYVDRGTAELAGYPAVRLKDDVIQVSSTIGKVPTGAPVTVFDAPLRVCVGAGLQGRKIGIRYRFFGKNLRQPVKGTLRLVFEI